jgi:hypothetical protein
VTWPVEAKRREFEHKLASIGTEFDHWRADSEHGRPLRKHHRQIAAITGQLDALRASIGDKLAALAGNHPSDDEELLRSWPGIQADILDVHRIWEFFRAKLALRYVNWFQGPLAVSDEFAWACYRPAQERAIGEGSLGASLTKEPPLIFFNGGWSPFAIARGNQYEAEYVPGETLSQAAMHEVLRGLPIPVIGIPWYQVEHLPEAVVIGHEVGHTVEEDFGLTDTMHRLTAAAVADAPFDQRAAWHAWAGEIFADLYGVLATGPAFVGAMMDFLAQDHDTIARQHQPDPNWEVHPPAGLRVEINLAALRAQHFGDEAELLERAWRQRFAAHAMQDFSTHVAPVVVQLLEGPYPEFGGVKLSDVLTFTETDQAEAMRTARDVLQDLAPGEGNIRRLVASARLAFEQDPSRYAAKAMDGRDAQARILARAIEVQTDEVRGPPRGADGDSAPSIEEGRHLLEKIGRLRQSDRAGTGDPARNHQTD